MGDVLNKAASQIKWEEDESNQLAAYGAQAGKRFFTLSVIGPPIISTRQTRAATEEGRTLSTQLQKSTYY